MRVRAAAALSSLALFGAACGGGGGTPAEQLESALSSLEGSDFAYEITLDVDNDVLAEAAASDPTLGQASLFAGSFNMRGAYVGDDSSFAVSVMGQEVLGLRMFDDQSEVYMQLGFVDLMAGFGMSSDDLLAEMRAQGGIPSGYDELVEAFFSGGWVGFENDPEAFEAAVDDEYRAQFGDPNEIREAFAPLLERFSDPAAFLDQYGTVTEGDAVEDMEVYEVELALRSLLGDLAKDFAEAMQAQSDNPAFSDLGADLDDFEAEVDEGLAEVPETVSGLTVGIRDGEVVMMSFDVGVAAQSMGEDGIQPGAAVITVTLEREGLPTISVPTDAIFFTSDQLVELMRSLEGAGV